ncbi:hypothetical protein [Nocardia sp. Marseille-Q1738]
MNATVSAGDPVAAQRDYRTTRCGKLTGGMLALRRARAYAEGTTAAEVDVAYSPGDTPRHGRWM